VAVVVLVGAERVDHVVVDLVGQSVLVLAADVDALVVEVGLHWLGARVPRT